MLGMSKPWGFLFSFLFPPFKKYMYLLCLCKPLLSRAGSSSSAASFVCKYASEACCLLSSVCWCYPHQWQGPVSSIPACSLPSAFPAQCRCGMRPLCARGSIHMDKAGWSTCLHHWTEMRGVVSKRQKKRKKSLCSLNF